MRFLLIFLLLSSLNLHAQSISGRVMDADGPLEFASVRLFDSKDSTVVAGIYTNQDGTFKLRAINNGNYFLKISFTNFSSFTLNPLLIEDGQSRDLGIVKLEISESLQLDDIVATGSLDVLKAGIDKKIYNVQDDIAVRGGTVNDVLNNIPSIDIDQNGNISLRGDGNVTILIDGRPSGLVLGDGQNLLDALPANSIQRIEVVTNPSAKYDPDGTSGIINIVMKKNKLKGFNGIVSSTLGGASFTSGQQFEANVALSYRNERFNLYTNYSYNQFRGFRNYLSTLEREVVSDSTIVLEQDRIGTDFKEGNTFVLGTDYFINNNHTIGFSGTFINGFRERTGDLSNQLFDGNKAIVDRWDRLSRDPRRNKNLDLNLNYGWKLKESKGELSVVAYQSIGEKAIEGFYIENYLSANGSPTSQQPLYQQLRNDQVSSLTTAQIDFSYILKEINARIETGSKAILNSEILSTSSQTLDTLSGQYLEDTVANFDYQYNGAIYSAYGIFGQEIGNFKYQIGLRGEFAQQDPVLIGDSNNYTNTYRNVFPSGHLKYKFNDKTELGLSYSKRINRPRARQLNPFTSYADPFNLRSGNPNLEPEYIDSYDFSYSYTSKKLIATFSMFYRRTRDVINRVKFYRENNTAIVTYGNIDNSESTGSELVLIYKPFKWWKNTISFNGNYIVYTNSDPETDWNNSGVNWGFKYIGSADFWDKTATVQINASYRAPRISPQGIVQPRTGIDISFEKRLLNKKLSIGTRVTDIFDTRGFDLELIQEGVRQVSQYKWLTRRFFITASFKFGKYESSKKLKPTSQGGMGL